jgi:transglutaminase-like putative cysteine protease
VAAIKARGIVTEQLTTRRAATDAVGERGLLLAVAGLLTAACLPLARVFVGLDFLWPVTGAALLAIALSWGVGRLGGGPLPALLSAAAGWTAFVSLLFARDTLAAGVLPTPETWQATVDLWRRGVEMMRSRPAPTFAEPGLLIITITGVWAVAHAVETLVFRLRAPVRAVLLAMVLWVVPLTLAPRSHHVWVWSAPFLGAAAAVLVAFAGTDLARWGTWVDPWTGGPLRNPRSAGLGRNPLAGAGALLAVAALLAGGLIAGRLPGFGDQPWYELRGRGETTVTTNPIVNIRTSLVASSDGPLLRVRSTRPVYLRTTSLDLYSDREEWTNGGISGDLPAGPYVPFEVEVGPAAPVSVEIEALRLQRAVLAPVPYQAVRIVGSAAGKLRYDPHLSTFTVATGLRLEEGDRYEVLAAVPEPDARTLNRVPARDRTGRLTALPDGVPPRVRQLARQIVEHAGARTSFEQALAIQDELRTWEYSLEPPEGHTSRAMASFLENRIGYCEQYAGTMTVMLRELGIPARVAVGFTPGRMIRDPADPTPTAQRVADDVPDVYLVSPSNAHAWVEVLFPGLGWIAFEPTPRDDGNVLVPSGANLAPAMTLAQATGDFEKELLSPLDERLLLQQEAEAAADRAALEQPSSSAAGEGRGRNVGAWAVVPLAAGGLATVLGLGLFLRLLRRPRPAFLDGAPKTAATARVERARAGVERIGRGLGVRPGIAETDREYLGRLAPDHDAAALLAACAGQARYARSLPADAAEEAERAAAELAGELLAAVPPLRRRLVPLRGVLSLCADDLQQRLVRPRKPDVGSATAVASLDADEAHTRFVSSRRRRRAPGVGASRNPTPQAGATQASSYRPSSRPRLSSR